MKVRYPSLFTKNFISHLPNQWDLVALTLLFGFFGWLAWSGSQMSAPYHTGSFAISLHPIQLFGYAALSVLRMFIALFLSLLFTFIVGTWAAKSKKAARFIIPVVDILQSVPVLGFLSLTVTGFIRLFPGSRFGPECAAIFAIFTAQVWNMILSFYQSLSSVPLELKEFTVLFQLSAWQRFWRLEVPFALPNLLWNMMLSMSGSWVFLVASESITVANQTIYLPGVGSYLGLAIAQGSLKAVGWAVGCMLLVILIYDQLFFRPLITWSYKFKSSQLPFEQAPRNWLILVLQRTRILKGLHHFVRYSSEWFLNITFNTNQFENRLNILPKQTNLFVKVLLWSIGVYCVGLLAYFGIYSIAWNEMTDVLFLGGITALRVMFVVTIATVFWVPIGVWIGLHPKLSSIVQPLAQFLAAFPANVFFPLVVITIIKYGLPFEVGILPLMLLSTQWYILFNVVAATDAFPKELYQMAQNFEIKGWIWWKRLILPGIFPSLIVGIMTAVGAAWNISVVVEAMQWKSTVLIAKGLGAYIFQASESGNFPSVAMGIIGMSLWVLAMNYLIWQPLYRLAQTKYRVD